MSDIRTTMDFVEELLELVPELKPVYDEHIKDNDEILPHVLFGDVTRYIVQQLRAGAIAPSSPLVRCLDFFEAGMASGDRKINELIGASFLENVAEFTDILPSLRKLIGPNLTKELRLHTQ